MATSDQPDDVTFSITLNSDENINPKLVADTIRDTEALLSDLETSITGTSEARVQWSWADDRPIELTAHVNGASREQLRRIVHEAERGFAAISEVKGPAIQWPEIFGRRAKSRAKRIVRRLENLGSITVAAEGEEPVTIEAAEAPMRLVSATVRAVDRQRLRSSVEGVLDVVSVRGRLKASITEHNTRKIVRCTLTDDLFETVKDMLKKRVVAEGMVSYRDDGTPVSITDITLIRPRLHGRDLDAFIGAAPNLTGGLDTVDFLERLRGEDE